jgi:hypothetical protein
MNLRLVRRFGYTPRLLVHPKGSSAEKGKQRVRSSSFSVSDVIGMSCDSQIYDESEFFFEKNCEAKAKRKRSERQIIFCEAKPSEFASLSQFFAILRNSTDLFHRPNNLSRIS